MNQIESTQELIPPPLSTTPLTVANDTRETILVVEDEALVREVMCEILVCQGYRVLKARRAAEARTMFRRCKQAVALLLTDVVLPDKNGRVLAQELQEICPELRAILISGYPNSALQAELITEGIPYLPKPFSAESLLEKVKLALG